jgi:hypothetical protein
MQGILQVEGVGIVREDEVAALGIDRVVFPLDRVLANALFESMLLHTRNLFEFLVRSGSRPDDMRISDFSEETWGPPAVPVGGLGLWSRKHSRGHCG